MTDAAAARGHGRETRVLEEKYCRRGHLKTYVDPGGKYHCRVCNHASVRRYYERKVQKRLAERRRRIAERARPPKEERVWAAGHFEGEGTFSIMSGGRRGLPRPRVSLASTDRSVIAFFQARWPGALRDWIPKTVTNRARRVYYWQLVGNDPVEGFVLDVYPHLQTERVRTKADLLLEHVRDSAELRRSPGVRARRFARMRRMRALNRRGVDRGRAED